MNPLDPSAAMPDWAGLDGTEGADWVSAIVRSTFDATVIIDDSGRAVLVNPAAERVFRCAAADVLGRSIARFMTDETAAALGRATSQLRSGSIAHAFNDPGQRLRRADGEEFEFESSTARLEVGGRTFFSIVVRDVEERRRQREENLRLTEQSDYFQAEIKATHNFDEIVGDSDSLTTMLRAVDLVAETDSTVLILGESGTGKELIARALHARSRRRARPLIKVNCAALPSGLIESELFGHVKGAFTGATSARVGRFELADGGTIFLDEVGELPLDLQAKLLRVLQEREFERLGAPKPIRVDVRVVAATNRDLSAMVAAGTFRDDLFFRLNVFPVEVPALRDRRRDIHLLAKFFLSRHARKIGRPIDRVPDDVMRRLIAYDWPGNVRELENVIERAVILSRGPALELDGQTLPARARAVAHRHTVVQSAGTAVPVSGASPGGTSFDDAARQHIVATLDATDWRVEGETGAARVLGLSPSTLRSRMKKLGIQRARPRLA